MNKLTQKVKFEEDEALSLAERTFSTEIDEQLASDIIQYARRLHNRYTAPQPAPNKLNADHGDEAPSHSLPNWSECNLRVGNSEWLKDNDRKPEHDSLTANPLHEFIYEYDDSDAYKSAWFLHRLEKLIGFIRSEQQPTPEVAELVEALEQVIKAAPSSGPLWHGSEQIDEARAALAAHRKPKTHIVHGVEIPDLRFTPKTYEEYYYPSTNHPSLALWTRSNYAHFNAADEHRLKHNLCYPPTEEGREAAILHAKAMLGIK